MKFRLSVPRWASVPSALAFAIGLTAACYPGGLVDAYEDCRDYGALSAGMAETERSDEECDRQLAFARQRQAYKEDLVSALLVGDATFATVTDQFAELNRGNGVLLSFLRVKYGDREVNELSALNVLAHLGRMPRSEQGSSAVLSRSLADFEARFGHPAPEL